ncbi:MULTISPECIES: FxsA family protein [Allobacillus]|uniref:FxsA family protein n=1 Tax=Allobacillus salarius TaxID=1955272 RepID=A0A556PQ01_9BACI|nr:FxsA family protein [Allobacillus salarius]TSJ66466.1 FxsA family protein [Allobacillus salarius]
MFRLLFLLIVVFSVIEIAIFVWLGNITSIWFVLIGIILTGVTGAFLAKWQGISTLNSARQAMANRRMPKDEIFDGIAILIGAVLLFTPGFLTDLVGFLLLIPTTRRPFKLWAQAQLLSMIKKGSVKRFHIYRR